MGITKNEGNIDRALRIVGGEAFFILAFFWFGGVTQIIFYVVALVLLLTGVFGFCGAYKLFGIHTCPIDGESMSKKFMTILAIVMVTLLVLGSYASNFFTKKIFLEDYTAMNGYYKQALFYTGQDKREEAVANYTKLLSAYAVFKSTYEQYHPYVIAQDANFNADLSKIEVAINVPKDKILTGDLKSAHLDLEIVRPMFQDILKRNGFSMLAVALVDFHDIMEKIIAVADAKDARLVIATYPEVSDKLKEVEAQANDVEIQSIRTNLDQLLKLAEEGKAEELSSQAAELKSSFVKVYLQRG